MNVTLLDLARKYLDVEEREGLADHPQIRAWLMRAGFGADAHDEIAWCGAMIGELARLLGTARSPTPARARSWLRVGTPVDIEDARPGFDVVVLSRGKLPQPGADVVDAPGHVMLYVSHDATKVTGVGGNQDNAVTVATFLRSRVLGVRRLHEE